MHSIPTSEHAIQLQSMPISEKKWGGGFYWKGASIRGNTVFLILVINLPSLSKPVRITSIHSVSSGVGIGSSSNELDFDCITSFRTSASDKGVNSDRV